MSTPLENIPDKQLLLLLESPNLVPNAELRKLLEQEALRRGLLVVPLL